VVFFVRLVPGGEFTTWLFAGSRIGASIQLAGPFGNLWLRASDAPVLCVAGGSGLAPIYAILEQAAREQCERDVVLVFGARQRRDLYRVPEIEELADTWRGSFSWIRILSQEDQSTEWTGRRGLVTDAVRRLDADFLQACDVYTCGPPVMVDALEASFGEIRMGSKFFHADRFVTRVANMAPGI
jgi:p-cymene monooxygenase electron transfer component